MTPMCPLMVDLRGKRVLLVGGGKAASLKARFFSRFGASLRVVAPEVLPELEALGPEEVRRRPFLEEDLEGVFLAVAASSDPRVNARVVELCRRRGILCCASGGGPTEVAVPSAVVRGPLVVSVSTSGLSPALSRAMRELLEELLPGELGDRVEGLGRLRVRGLSQGEGVEEILGWLKGCLRAKVEGWDQG